MTYSKQKNNNNAAELIHNTQPLLVSINVSVLLQILTLDNCLKWCLKHNKISTNKLNIAFFWKE